MSKLERRQDQGLLPELFEWVGSPFAALNPLAGQAVKVEEYVEGGDYVVRAELPDVDIDKDVEITASDGMLRIHGERRTEQKEEHRSEFRYGSFSRTLSLPPGVTADDIKASYDKGVLTITVPLPEAGRSGAQRITVEKR